MAELEKFLKTLDGKSKNTIKTYTIQYNKLLNLTEKPIAETSQLKLIKLIADTSNPNGRQALLNIAIQLRRGENAAVDKLIGQRDKNKVIITDEIKNTNLKLQNSLPSYKTIVDYMESLYNSSEWTDYIINYLLINYQVRNADLLFDIVKRKRDTKDTTKNYIWLSAKKAVFIRNVYKTNTTYGRKENIITDSKFITAIKRVFACQKHNENCGVFIPTASQVGYYIQKASYNQIGEGAYFKIIVAHFRDNIDKLEEIGENRGTSYETIKNSYDIANV